MAATTSYNPAGADATHDFFNVSIPTSKLDDSAIIDHMAVKKGFFTRTEVEATVLNSKIQELITDKLSGDGFDIQAKKLGDALSEIKDHERYEKIGLGSGISKAKLEGHAETAYREIDKIKKKVQQYSTDFQKSKETVRDKLRSFGKFQDEEIKKGLDQFKAAGPKAKIKIDALTIDVDARDKIANLLDKAPDAEITVEELGKARGKLASFVKDRTEEIVNVIDNNVKGTTQMLEHLEKEAEMVKRVTKVERTAASAVVSVIEHGVPHPQGPLKVPPAHMPFVAGGAALGALAGYMTADEDKKVQNTVIGGAAGGIVGRIVSGFRSATTNLGAMVGGHSGQVLAERMAEKAPGVLSHLR